ncbi:MAG TPA: SLC13 family permease [Thermomicrobiales bacterium]|nr:SLC13 family permease [Thermomicrobiales bacterium]
MTVEIAIVFGILLLALVGFVLDRFPLDFVALSVMATILVLGPVLDVTAEEAISGFAHPATITVLAVFILAGGVQRTGAINLLTRRMIRHAGDGEVRQLLAVMLIVAPFSAFINNTAAVAILIPPVIALSRHHKRPPSRLLIPLSYASQMAGVMTLIGTSTNILASSLLDRDGREGFSMFEFSHIGALVFATGAIYLIVAGRRLLPDRETAPEVASRYQVSDFQSDIVVLPGSGLAGKSLAESHLGDRYDMQVRAIQREGRRIGNISGRTILLEGDILTVVASPDQLMRVNEIEGLEVEPVARLNDDDEPDEDEERGVLEVVIGPNSDLVGRTLESSYFRNRYNATVIAIRKQGQVIHERLGKVRLAFGDTLLLAGDQEVFELIKRRPGFIVTEETRLESFRTSRIPIALAIVAGVVIVAAFGQPILVTAVTGSVLMVLTGCLRMTELHESIRWDVILLLAGMIPLGIALERTGAARLLADLATASARYVPDLIVLMIFYALTAVLTEFISNNASVVVMVPVGIATAVTLELDPRAFVLAIMFAASTSFTTPTGYQTNTMVYGPGGYRFVDFVRVGGALNVILAILTPLYIYLFWGL